MSDAHLRIFVSSVQKELEDERLTVQNLLSTDPFLSAHCLPILYELEPASPDSANAGCLRTLDSCHVYMLIVWRQYGACVGDISITRHEYRRAKANGIPILIFIKGDRQMSREDGTNDFLKELDKDGFKYKRFGNVIELQKEVRAALLKLLKERFIEPTSDENEIAHQTIEATSSFESQAEKRLAWERLDHTVARVLVATAENKADGELTDDDVLEGVILRGLVWRDSDSGQYLATAAGVVLLANDPSVVYPQCRILADAYRGTQPDGAPNDHENICGPMPLVVERAIAFIDRNTRHPMRIVGLNRVRLDEYPTEALREALVNAVAHRQYEDASRKILLEVFSDRIVISSPGLPPAPLTIDKLRKGKYKPCSRNPVLAQCLSYFHRIEERGSGIRRMRDQMLAHGLDQPLLASQTGYFQVIFRGPGKDLRKLRVTAGTVGQIFEPSLQEQMNERQKTIVVQVLREGYVTSGWCVKHLSVTYDTANRDLLALAGLRVLAREGKGRNTRYVLAEKGPS